MRSGSIKAVIFDCDGVMFDTTEANTAYYNRILRHFGRPPLTPGQFAYCQMHTVDNALRHLFEASGQLAEARAYRLQMGYRQFIPLMALEPHLKPLLRRLRPHLKTAVGTNRSDTMDEVLTTHGLMDSFDLIVTSQDVAAPKPAPDILTRILSEFRIAAEQAIYIGDSALDEQAAAAAGMPLVAYRNPALQAWRHIDTLDAVHGLLDNAGPAA